MDPFYALITPMGAPPDKPPDTVKPIPLYLSCPIPQACRLGGDPAVMAYRLLKWRQRMQFEVQRGTR